MRLGPATQAALLSRMLLAAVFRPKEKTIAYWRSKEGRAVMSGLKLAPQVCRFSASIPPLEGKDLGGGRNARAPAHWT
jgi:hypothetical protein